MADDPPEIFDARSLSQWLSSWFEWWRNLQHGHNHRALAALLGSRDPSVIHNAINGRRPLSERTIDALLKTVWTDLDTLEIRYLRTLAARARARGTQQEELERLADEMRAERAVVRLAQDHLEILSNWWYFAVACLAEGQHGVDLDDPSAVARALYQRVDANEARQAVEVLRRLGLLVVEEGRYRLRQPIFSTPVYAIRHATRRYHAEVVGLSLRVLEELASLPKVEQQLRYFSGATCSLSTDDFLWARQEIFDLQQRILARSAQSTRGPGPHRVYQLNLQLLVLSQAVGTGDVEKGPNR